MAEHTSDSEPQSAPLDISSQIPTIDYAFPDVPRPKNTSRDSLELTIAIFQTAASAFVFLLVSFDSDSYTEVTGGSALQRLAWHFTRPEVMLFAWAAVSLIALVGSLVSPARRRRMYVIHAAAFMLSLLIIFAAYSMMGHELRERLVVIRYGSPYFGSWESVVGGESGFYFGISLMALIVNPMLILLFVRYLKMASSPKPSGQSTITINP